MEQTNVEFTRSREITCLFILVACLLCSKMFWNCCFSLQSDAEAICRVSCRFHSTPATVFLCDFTTRFWLSDGTYSGGFNSVSQWDELLQPQWSTKLWELVVKEEQVWNFGLYDIGSHKGFETSKSEQSQDTSIEGGQKILPLTCRGTAFHVAPPLPNVAFWTYKKTSCLPGLRARAPTA